MLWRKRLAEEVSFEMRMEDHNHETCEQAVLDQTMMVESCVTEGRVTKTAAQLEQVMCCISKGSDCDLENETRLSWWM